MARVHPADRRLCHSLLLERRDIRDREKRLDYLPHDCEFKRVPQCPSRRVSTLKFKAGSKRLFWMQEPKTDQDEEHCREVNEYLNNHPHMPGDLGASGGGAHELSTLGGASATSPSPAPSSGNGTSAATSPTQPIQLSDLQSILVTMNVPARLGSSQQVGLTSVLTPEIMVPNLANANVQQHMLPYLPFRESLPQTAGEIQSTLTSPQFQQTLIMFSTALASRQLGPFICQFGLPAEAVEATNKGDVEAFAKAMQNKARPEQKESDSKDKKDDEEDMSLN
ncbi:Proteasomal ubiquitin receptor ADRM1 [Sciurus carolinensis]|uniref:Proteasomal ubiquitin receptor ADRM1 n=1 Tax=Sciurus carolinensis TaxID=30640 RepID=A0AA41MTK9_SCICA|nr:Proteasomal ubiquitin receptor ADRM1 [Sciurus carolinensis]